MYSVNVHTPTYAWIEEVNVWTLNIEKKKQIMIQNQKYTRKGNTMQTIN